MITKSTSLIGRDRRVQTYGKKVSLISSNSILAEGFRRIMDRDSRLHLCSKIRSFGELWSSQGRLEHDLLLVDVQIVCERWKPVLPSLLHKVDSPVLLIVFNANRKHWPFEKIPKGMGVLCADLPPLVLLRELQQAVTLSAEPQEATPSVTEKPAGEILSRRELDTLREAAVGKSNKEISQRLGISAETVKFHMKKIQAKLGVPNRTSAVIKAIREHAIELPDERLRD